MSMFEKFGKIFGKKPELGKQNDDSIYGDSKQDSELIGRPAKMAEEPKKNLVGKSNQPISSDKSPSKPKNLAWPAKAAAEAPQKKEAPQNIKVDKKQETKEFKAIAKKNQKPGEESKAQEKPGAKQVAETPKAQLGAGAPPKISTGQPDGQNSIVTDFDMVVSYISQHGRAPFTQISKDLGMPWSRIEECSNILRNERQIEIIYLPFGDPIATVLGYSEKNKEKGSLRARQKVV